MLRSSTIPLVLLMIHGCAATGPQSGTAALAPGSIPPVPEAEPVSAARAAFYKGAFANARRFVAKPIPRSMIRAINQGNEDYVVALGPGDEVVGYLRDFTGPVVLGQECECSPLSLTLAYAPDHSFSTILSAAPLQKQGHAPLTDKEFARLIELAKDPPRELLKARSTEAVVDVITGATKPEYKDHTVPLAALSTRRIVGLVHDTRRILQGAPLTIDRGRLQIVLDATRANDAERARALARLIPTTESPDVAVVSYRMMLQAYLDAQRDGAAADSEVEARLIAQDTARGITSGEVASGCYELATAGFRISVADRCARDLRKKNGVSDGAWARLAGTVEYMAGKMRRAAALLARAAPTYRIERDPHMHLRLADAWAKTQRNNAACKTARALFVDHPLLSGVKNVLKSCSSDGNIVALIEQLHAEQRQRLLSNRLSGGSPVPSLSLEGKDFKEVELPLHEVGKITVAVFFATWCPHCRAELPRIVAFVHATASQPRLKDKVRVVGIRTATEKEKQPYAEFLATFKPNFPIYTDAVMAMAFSKFSKSQNLAASLPTVAIIDGQGIIRYIVASGDHRDTGRELLWAIDSLLASDSATH